MTYETPDQPPIQPATLTAPPKPSVLAIISLCLGIVSIPLIFVCIGWFTALAGLILGIIALVNIQSSNGAIKGKGLAIGGLISSVLSMVIFGCVIAVMQGPSSGGSFESILDQAIKEAEAKEASGVTPETEAAPE
jgi:hypothetical protein